MKQKLFTFIFLMCLFPVCFAVSSPVVMLDKVAHQVINELEKNKASLNNNPQFVYSLVSRILIPHVDVNGMSRSVLDRNTWRQITPRQKQRFTKEFTRLVVRTYSVALAEYSDETIEFLPIVGGYEGKSRVHVKSVIKRRGGQDIRLNYRLILMGQQWKVYDMSVEGVSILQSFRPQFRNELRRGSFDDLINHLRAGNDRAVS